MSESIKDIYLIGICGVAMGTLAGMLKKSGYMVRGSDSGIYPPMSDKLKEWEIDAYNGYNAENVGKPDLAIIGNAISRGNPEAEYVLNKRIPYMSMAQAIYNFFLKDKEIISVSGTHGKTTTTALLNNILVAAGEDPSCLIGGVSVNLNSNFRIGGGKHFIIEGDEYDSAFFEKIPKFIVYKPHHLVLTSLEFDHADIYNNLDEIKLWFRRLVNITPSEGEIIFSNDYSNLIEVTEKSFSKLTSFGKGDSDFKYEFCGYSGIFSGIKIISKKYGKIDIKTKLFGEYNYANITAAAAMALQLGIGIEDIKKAVEMFEGVKRRQELIYESGNLKIYEDFAHHPTAINFFLSEMKNRFPDSCLWAVYEPRSATSRRNIFQKELPLSFRFADKVLLKNPFSMNGIPEQERIDISSVLNEIKASGKEAVLFNNADEILNFIFGNIKKDNNIIAIMSNGSFDGIYDKIKVRAQSYNNGLRN